jgi:DNA-binding FadR family transcriptional regulator
MAVTDEAIEQIKAMILSGELSPGDRLPREADLALRLGVSRNSLREAVRALTLVHVLDVRQGDGTYVTSLQPALLLDAMSFIVDFHRDASVLEFLEVRRILEPAATAMAATRITQEEVAELRRLADLSDAGSSVDDLVKHDTELHRQIAQISGNLVLASLLDSIAAPTARARVWRGLTQAGALERTLEEHRLIIDALEAHQPDVAGARALVHVAGVEDWLRRVP